MFVENDIEQNDQVTSQLHQLSHRHLIYNLQLDDRKTNKYIPGSRRTSKRTLFVFMSRIRK
jgi:uncharacterized protein YihD (DUF1040 family)